MKILKAAAPLGTLAPRGCVVALGFFDGVHRAHAAVLAAAREEALRSALPLLVFTFRAEDAPKVGTPHLSDDAQRAALFAAAGADMAVFSEFSALSHLTPEAFVDTVLVGALGTRVAVTGDGFRFGHRAAGDAACLGRLLAKHGAAAVALPPVLHGGEPISSTRVRQALERGDCAEATALLGRPYDLTLPVVRGDGRGVGLGFPTANLCPPAGRALPRFGVYVTRVGLPDGKAAFGVTDVGTRPTVAGSEVRLETHILDHTGELYGEPLTLEFLTRLRGEVKFSSLSELSERIRMDCEEVRIWLRQNGQS
ncbi:MAG: riboflavin biosynthesis protein RibF [Clostridia bacterium]|nr:riboflavin biosynthesis protein RibF [Clostridia bacterium]